MNATAENIQSISSPVMNIMELLVSSGSSARTGREYKSDLILMAEMVGMSLHGFLAELLSAREAAITLATRLKRIMIDVNHAPNTVNRRLATLRNFMRMAREMGAVEWSIEIKNLRKSNIRDTRGPSVRKVQDMLDTFDPETAQGARDLAIITLLSTVGLRRSELTEMDLADFDPVDCKIRVRRKGELGYTDLAIPEAVRDAINQWVKFRGPADGPLFRNFDRAQRRSGRLSGRSIANITKAAGGYSPHALRHTAITTAIKVAQSVGVEFTECRQFSGHKHVDTLLIYRDQVRNTQGRLADAVAEKILGRLR